MNILLAVDCQLDFMPGGSLPVPGGDEIVPIINSIRSKFDEVIWTKDWHPSDHCSFKKTGNGGLWPDHCVQGTPGAELHKDLHLGHNDLFIVKGTDPSIDSYSGFYDNERKQATELVSYLKKLSENAFLHEGTKPKLWIVGLATEYCVRFTVMDALKEGYETYIVLDACRGINPANIRQAQEDMVDAGALITSSKAILKWVKNEIGP